MMVSNVADGMLLPPEHASGDSALESRNVLLSTATFQAFWCEHQEVPPPALDPPTNPNPKPNPNPNPNPDPNPNPNPNRACSHFGVPP